MITVKQSQALHYTYYLNGSISEDNQFEEIVALLNNAEPDDIVEIHVNSGGGRLDITTALINAILSTQATVIGVLAGNAYSAAALIFLACESQIVFPTGDLMLHEVLHGGYDQGSKMLCSAQHISKQFKALYNLVAAGFLNDDELADMYKGVEHYFLGDELHDRLERMHKLREEAAEKAELEE